MCGKIGLEVKEAPLLQLAAKVFEIFLLTNIQN